MSTPLQAQQQQKAEAQQRQRAITATRIARPTPTPAIMRPASTVQTDAGIIPAGYTVNVPVGYKVESATVLPSGELAVTLELVPRTSTKGLSLETQLALKYGIPILQGLETTVVDVETFLGTKPPSALVSTEIDKAFDLPPQPKQLPISRISYTPQGGLTYGEWIELIGTPAFALAAPELIPTMTLTFVASEAIQQAPVIGKGPHIPTWSELAQTAFISAGAVYAWEEILPESVTSPIERATSTLASYAKTGITTVLENLPSPMSDIYESVSDIPSNVGSWFRATASPTLLKLVYGEDLATYIMQERTFTWTEPVLSMEGITQQFSGERFLAWQQLYLETEPFQTPSQSFYLVTRGSAQTPMSVTLDKALVKIMADGAGAGFLETILIPKDSSLFLDEELNETVQKISVGGAFGFFTSPQSSFFIGSTLVSNLRLKPSSKPTLKSDQIIDLLLEPDTTVSTVQVAGQKSAQKTASTLQQVSSFISEMGMTEETMLITESDFFNPYGPLPTPKRRKRKRGGYGLVFRQWPVPTSKEYLKMMLG